MKNISTARKLPVRGSKRRKAFLFVPTLLLLCVMTCLLLSSSPSSSLPVTPRVQKPLPVRQNASTVSVVMVDDGDMGPAKTSDDLIWEGLLAFVRLCATEPDGGNFSATSQIPQMTKEYTDVSSLYILTSQTPQRVATLLGRKADYYDLSTGTTRLSFWGSIPFPLWFGTSRGEACDAVSTVTLVASDVDTVESAGVAALNAARMAASAAVSGDSDNYVLVLSTGLYPVASLQRSRPPPSCGSDSVKNAAAHGASSPLFDETRRLSSGFLSSLLLTLQRPLDSNVVRNVAAAQCTILQRHDPSPFPSAPTLGASTPDLLHLGVRELSNYTVLDKGVVAMATVRDGALSPYLARHMAQSTATDQRALWDTRVTAVSLRCTLFRASALRTPDIAVAVGLQESGLPDNADWAGWEWSLRLQTLSTEWGVWGSGAAAVALAERNFSVEKTPPPLRSSIAVLAAQPTYGIRNGFGERHFVVLRQLIQSKSVDQLSVTPPVLPVVRYATTFPCLCCGLGLEAHALIRSLAGHVVLSTELRSQCRSYVPYPHVAPQYRKTKFSFDGVRLKPRNGQLNHWHALFHELFPVLIMHGASADYRGLTERNQEYRSFTIGRLLAESVPLPSSVLKKMRTLSTLEFTPAQFLADAMVNGSVPPEKIHIIPVPVDAYRMDPSLCEPSSTAAVMSDSWNERARLYDSRPQMPESERRSRFVFLSIFKWELRKGWDRLLQAYWMAFGPGAALKDNLPPPAVTLMIKTGFFAKYPTGFKREEFPQFLHNWSLSNLPGYAAPEQLPHLVVYEGGLETSSLIEMQCRSNAYVSLSHGEGWGLPAAEAMAMGKITVMTNWSGYAQIGSPDASLMVPVERMVPAWVPAGGTPRPGEQSIWAEPSLPDAAKLMRRAVTMPLSEAAAMSMAARRRAVQYFSEEAVGSRIARILATEMAKRS